MSFITSTVPARSNFPHRQNPRFAKWKRPMLPKLFKKRRRKRSLIGWPSLALEFCRHDELYERPGRVFSMKPKIKSCLFNSTGGMHVYDASGGQLPDLQKNVFCLWAEHAAKAGYNPEGVIIETSLRKLQVVKNSDNSWNLEILSPHVEGLKLPIRDPRPDGKRRL